MDLLHIIDKTAAYVLKNGKEFEDILRTKNDPRFSFLCSSDEFHRYYIYKVTGIIYPGNTETKTGNGKADTMASVRNLAAEVTAKLSDPKVLTKATLPKIKITEPKVISTFCMLNYGPCSYN